MQELLLIAVGAAFVNNVVLSQFLGICPFFRCFLKNVKKLQPEWAEQLYSLSQSLRL